MNGGALGVSGYRLRATFERRRGAYLSLVLLIGLVGGLAMGALTAARRTESSFPTFLASTNPSNLSLGTALYDPALGYTTGYDGPLVDTIARLPDVRHAESYAEIYSVPLGPNGEPTKAAENANMNVEGSLNGLFFNQDRVTVVQGRMADPDRADEIMMTAGAARSLGLHVGQTVPWGTYANAQFSSATAAPPAPALHERLTLVGTVVLNNEVVQDDIDANGPTTAILTPALTRQLVACCSNYSFTYLQLDHGSSDVGVVEAEIERVIPSVLPFDFYDTSIDVTKAQNAIKPEAIALGVFGLIAALAALLIAGQVIGRQLGFWAHEERTLRALGAGPAMTARDGLVGIMGAVVLGALMAGAVAVALSPLAPLGPGPPRTTPTPASPSTGPCSASACWRSSSSSAPWPSCSALQRAPHRAAGWRSRPARSVARSPAPRHRRACPSRPSRASASPSNPGRSRRRAGALCRPRRGA